MGAAYLAGLSTGFWESEEALRGLREHDEHFFCAMDEEQRAHKMEAWHKAVGRVLTHKA